MFSSKECEVLANGLDLFVRQQRDVIQAAASVLTIRQKIDAAAKEAAEKEEKKAEDKEGG